MTREVPDEQAFLARVAEYRQRLADLTPLQAGLLAAAALDIASDSRAFARIFGLSHALVLRELNLVATQLGLIRLVKRDERTLRTFYTLVEAVPDD